MAKKNKKFGSPRKKNLSDKVFDTLQEISELIEKDDFDPAYDLLEPLLQKYPANDEVWEERAHFYMNLGDVSEAWWSSYRTLQLNRDNMQALTNLIYLSTEMELQWATQYYIERYAENSIFLPPQFTRMNETFAELNQQFYEKNPGTEGKKLADLALIDISRMLMSFGELEETVAICRRASKIFPNLSTLRQTMAVLLMSQGKLDKAIEHLIDTRSNFTEDMVSEYLLGQFHCLYGDMEAGEKIYQDFKSRIPKNTIEYTQRIQLLALLDKPAEIVSTYEAHSDMELLPNILHFVAAAMAVTGDLKQAKKLWKDMTDLNIASENLQDLDLDISRQKGVTYFELDFVMPLQWLNTLSEPTKSESQLKMRIDKLFKDAPWFENHLHLLLWRGDSIAREFVVFISRQHPLPMLREFALGTTGSDLQRLSILWILLVAGELSADDLPDVMINGQWQKPELFKYKVNTEAQYDELPKDLQRKLENCYKLLLAKHFDEALESIEELLTIISDNPALFNFKLTALKSMGEDKQADELLEEMLEKFPDYHFARMDKARQLIENKQFDEAQKWIELVESQPEFHFSELQSYAVTKIDLFVARKEDDSARNWLHQLEAILPNISKDLEMYHRKLDNPLKSIPLLNKFL